MLLRNKTNGWRKIEGKIVRPWREINVPEGTVFDETIFERISKPITAPKNKKEKIE